MSQKLFTDLGLSPELLKAVEAMGFEQPSPIQAEAIPVLLAGKDLIGQSQTGSGKTAAFGLPAVELVEAKKTVPQVLILCPTRELAAQVAQEIAKLAQHKKGVRELPIYGGASYERQFRGLKAGPQIIIGTPGRVIDHIQGGALRLDAVKMVILDEADRMLDMGFREDMETILRSVPKERQTVLFSATLPPGIQKIIEQFTQSPARIRIESTAKTVPNIEQSYLDVDFRSKTEVLCRLLDLHGVKSGIVFGFTKVQVDEVTDALVAQGYSVDKLHGDMSQAMRERVMKRFRERTIELLVATDVAARGLDVDDLELVVNYELPHDPEDYVHRIGRTGRAGKSGKAISLVSGREYGRLQQVMRFTGLQIPRVKVPKLEELEQKHANKLLEAVRETLASGQVPVLEHVADELLENHSPAEVISALMHLLGEEKIRPAEKIREDFAPGDAPRPERVKKAKKEAREDFSAIDDQTGVWLRFNIGKNVGMTPGDVVGCIAGETGLPREVVGSISILPSITLVQVAEEHAEEILAAVDGVSLRRRKLGASFGTPPEPRAAAPRSRGPRRDFDEYAPKRGAFRSGGSSDGGYGEKPYRGGPGGGKRKAAPNPFTAPEARGKRKKRF
jgi:ATP-dependent RNA helicase DeaD